MEMDWKPVSIASPLVTIVGNAQFLSKARLCRNQKSGNDYTATYFCDAPGFKTSLSLHK